MNVFFTILLHVILPVFALIILGAALQRKLKFDLGTFSRLSTYVLMPAVSFTNIYDSQIDQGLFVQIIGFLLLQTLLLILLSSALAKFSSFDRGLTSSFKNSVVLMNSGNYGLPVSQLVFAANPLGTSVQVIVFIYQNLLTSTYGLINSVSTQLQGKKVLREFLKMPTLYAVVLGVVFHTLTIEIPDFIWQPLDNMASSFLAIALLALGAQSTYLKFNRLSYALVLSLLCRLVIAPCIALAIIYCFGLDGTLAQALFIASSFPTSRNSAMYALEFNNHPEYAAQAVIVSTLLSALTVTVVISLSKVLF